jgi:hypothetical protein
MSTKTFFAWAAGLFRRKPNDGELTGEAQVNAMD